MGLVSDEGNLKVTCARRGTGSLPHSCSPRGLLPIVALDGIGTDPPGAPGPHRRDYLKQSEHRWDQ